MTLAGFSFILRQMNHYDTLGVSTSATPDEIKKAFRKLASQHHPDKGGDTAKFQDIQAAYDTLGDPGKRQQYDLERSGNPGMRFTVNGHPFDGFGGVPPGMEDFFKNFNFNVRRQKQNKDIRISITVPIFETLSDQRKTISIQTSRGRENVEIQLPRGITSGNIIKFSGLGDNLHDDVHRGDLYVEIMVIADRRFTIQDLDVIINYQLDSFDAMLGKEIEVEGIDNKKFTLQVPVGIQHGTKLRIRAQGLYHMHSADRGNLLVNIQIITPTGLNDNQINLIKQIKGIQ